MHHPQSKETHIHPRVGLKGGPKRGENLLHPIVISLSPSSSLPPCQHINYFFLTALREHGAFSDPSWSDPCSPSITVDFGQLLHGCAAPWTCLLNPPSPQSPDQLPSRPTETEVSQLCACRINPAKTHVAYSTGHPYQKRDQQSSRYSSSLGGLHPDGFTGMRWEVEESSLRHVMR